MSSLRFRMGDVLFWVVGFRAWSSWGAGFGCCLGSGVPTPSLLGGLQYL